MPLASQDTTVTLEAYIKNAAGDLVVCSDLSLTVYDPLSVPLTGFPVSEPPIVADSLGHYTYAWTVSATADLGQYLAVWSGTVGGVAVTGQEQWEVVSGGMITPGPADFITTAQYDDIRHLLGVTDLDLEDDTISSFAFVQHAELRVKSAVPDWQTMDTDSTEWEYLQLATIYGTAALLAETFAKGGMVALARGPSVQGRTIAEWDAIAKTLWGHFPQLIGATKDTPAPTVETLYDFALVRKSGPTSKKIREDKVAGTVDDLLKAWRTGNPKYFAGDLPR